MSDTYYAHAESFREQVVYYPQVRPGYVAWVSLFWFGNNELGMAFNEIRRACNPSFTPPSLEFIEAMGLPYRTGPDALPASSPNLVSEYVYLKSTDLGRSWTKTGSCPVYTRHYWHVGFPDGRLVRIIGTQHYRYELGDERTGNPIEESTDGGTTWRQIARIMAGGFFYVHKFKKIRDGSIVAVGLMQPSFGPGGEVATRKTIVPGHLEPNQSAFLISADGGHEWDGPHYILPGIQAHEPDFVQCQDGSLLFINSTVQAGRAVRQRVSKNATGFLNGPLMEIQRGAEGDWRQDAGFTPETVVMTSEGLIVGARRGKPYSCSQDMGENWYEIEGLPNCNYQPTIELLPDGRLLTAWHFGGDTRFGEIDMHIGTHEFAVQTEIPEPTRLSLERGLSNDSKQYKNVFVSTLTSGGRPLPGREIELRVKDHWLPQPDGRQNPSDVWESSDVRTAVTDQNGVATFWLQEKDAIPDIHHAYEVAPSYTPKQGEKFAACKGPVWGAYALTPARRDPAPYPMYIVHGLIMARQDVVDEFPELPAIIKAFNVPDPDAAMQRWVAVVGDQKRAEQILKLLMRHHIVTKNAHGLYCWYRSVHSGREGEPWIKELRVCTLEEHYR